VTASHADALAEAKCSAAELEEFAGLQALLLEGEVSAQAGDFPGGLHVDALVGAEDVVTGVMRVGQADLAGLALCTEAGTGARISAAERVTLAHLIVVVRDGEGGLPAVVLVEVLAVAEADTLGVNRQLALIGTARSGLLALMQAVDADTVE